MDTAIEQDLRNQVAALTAELVSHRLDAIELHQRDQNGHLARIDATIRKGAWWAISMLAVACGSLVLALIQFFLHTKAIA